MRPAAQAPKPLSVTLSPSSCDLVNCYHRPDGSICPFLGCRCFPLWPFSSHRCDITEYSTGKGCHQRTRGSGRSWPWRPRFCPTLCRSGSGGEPRAWGRIPVRFSRSLLCCRVCRGGGAPQMRPGGAWAQAVGGFGCLPREFVFCVLRVPVCALWLGAAPGRMSWVAGTSASCRQHSNVCSELSTCCFQPHFMEQENASGGQTIDPG